MFKHCPGVRSFVSPQIIIKKCPFCGEEVEFFEYENRQVCPNCGRVVYREVSEVCVSWCPYAEKCIEELERKKLLDEERIKELKKLLKQG